MRYTQLVMLLSKQFCCGLLGVKRKIGAADLGTAEGKRGQGCCIQEQAAKYGKITHRMKASRSDRHDKLFVWITVNIGISKNYQVKVHVHESMSCTLQSVASLLRWKNHD